MSETGRTTRRPQRLTGGLTLLAVGVLFYARHPTPFAFHSERWWAAFMLIPLLAAVAPSPSRANRLRGGFMAAAVAAIFLFTPGFGSAWPVFLILVALPLLV